MAKGGLALLQSIPQQEQQAIVADWHGSRAIQGFEQYAKAWIIQGGAKNKHAHKLLCELFGLDTDPTPRRAA
ncbi:hypothetical protein K4A76_06855 [Pseudomonas sp. NEEL19]|uniref:hypothetical protein n=1 Tax=Pseudomonas sp. NEEL19 TaxID=2867409 RepID=UPI0023678BF9|nr:hypothetical protein [Pseudomonas sp. NEEL19]WDM61757.1 hypothetical protein K4A76_06855 [Pseudomonas sp. NEEL19]